MPIDPSKNADPERWGLVPNVDVREFFPEDDPELSRAIAAAAKGQWEPVAATMAASWGDWERRTRVTQALANEGARSDEVLNNWRDAHPDRDLAVLDAASWVRVAEQILGDSDEQEHIDGHQRVLRRAERVARQTAELAPEDPTPWWLLVRIARGLSFDQARFAEIWHELVTRAPHHRAAHEEAVRYWAAESTDVMFDFAAKNPALVLRAAFAVEDDDELIWRTPLVTEAMEALHAEPELSRDDHGYLILALYDHRRYADVIDHFRALGKHADGAPWDRYDDPKGTFIEYRTNACLRAKIS